MRRYIIFILCSVVSLFMMRCVESNVAGGGTIETTNGIVGAIYNGDNSPAESGIVRLYPENYDPVTDELPEYDFTDTTDEDGAYRFEHIAPGRYTLLARDDTASTSLLVSSIRIMEDSIDTLAAEMLERSGSIVADFSGAAPFDSSTYLYIPGTDIFTFVANSTQALLNDVPSGRFSDVILAINDGDKRNILREEVTIDSGDTLLIPKPLWKYSNEIILNTSSTGALVSEDVLDFPVLIRLDSSFFDFSLSRADGEDVVFTDKNNRSFPREIERWDAVSGFAELWVRVDTVYGNSATQSIMMYWGNSDRSDAAETATVFDTATGFQGVWHLGADEGTTFRDATVNGYHGISPDTACPESVEGIVGKCREFDGSVDFITMPNSAGGKLDFSEQAEFTVSAWVNLAAFDNVSHCIVSKGAEQYFLRATYVGEMTIVEDPLWEFVEFSEIDKWQTNTCPASNGEWVFLAGVCQGDRQVLFCNGELVDSSLFLWPNDEAVRNTSNDLYVGRFAEEVTLPPLGPQVVGYNHFKGSIDEVRILSKAQSSAWVRLCYMNQRSDDRLVQFK